MKRRGERIVAAFRECLDSLQSGKPMRQSVIRRMKVKGETVHVRDTFTAPVGFAGPDERSADEAFEQR